MSVQVQNSQGQWVPAIPLPFFTLLGVRCGKCSHRFYTKRGYRGHYALMHILGLD